MKRTLRIPLLIISLFVNAPAFAQSWMNPGNSYVCPYGVNTLQEYNGELYVMGVTQITKWNGSSWSNVVVVQTIGTDQVWAMAVYNNELYISGTFSWLGIPANNIVKYNGSSWSTVGAGLTGIASALTVHNGELYATGYQGAAIWNGNSLAKWNGTAWSAVGTNSNLTGSVFDLLSWSGELYACGYFSNIGGVTASNIAKWNGTSWSTLGSGTNFYTNTLAVFNNELYAGGYFTGAGGLWLDNIARWNGSAWNDVGGGIIGPSAGSASAEVNSMVVYNGALFVAGEYSYAGSVPALNIAKWDGTNWYNIGDITGGGVCGGTYGLGVYSEQLFVGGLYDQAGPIAAFNIAIYDEFTAGTIFPSAVNTVTVFPNPFHQSAKVEMASNAESARLISMEGKICRDYPDLPDGKSFHLDAGNLPSGNYTLLILDQENNSSAVQLIIE